MSVDPYAMCPCGSGKKLKFCCSDLVGDIEKIHRMLEGDQPRAALQHTEQTLRRRPGKPPLLDLKAMLEITLGKLEDAEQTIALLLEKDPENPAAHAQKAILLCAKGESRPAVEPLQRALALIAENMPRRVLEAIGAVGHSLLIEGNVIAARAHLWLYQGIAGKDDTRALELLARLNQVASLPLLLRDHLYMHESPEGHPAEDQHNYAQALAARGQWGPASVVFDRLCAEHPDVPTLHYNRALVHGWLGDLETFSAALREFAKGDVPLEDAVEAEAIAQLVDPAIREPEIDVVKLVYPVLDEEEVSARLSRDPLFAPTPFDPSEMDQEEGPPPRAIYAQLDRPMPDSPEDLTWEETPKILGPLSQYGRQTDRSERLELLLAKDARYEEARKQLEQKLQGVVGVAEEEHVGQTDAPTEALRKHLRFPDGTPAELRRKITQQETHTALSDVWVATPLAVLGGATPRDAAQDPGQRIPLLAAVLLLEQGAQNFRSTAAIAALRSSIGLDPPTPIPSEGLDYDRAPLGRLPRVDLSQVADDDLALLYRRASLAGASVALRHVAQEAVSRESLEDQINLDEAYRHLVSLAEDPAESFVALEAARARADRRGVSNAVWDLLELELRIIEGNQERANELLQHINQDHVEEPGVAEHLYELFYQLGVIPEEAGQEPMAAGPPNMAAPPAAEPGKIWTPDSDQSAGKQKLWTPG